jgi:hypothetical protein
MPTRRDPIGLRKRIIIQAPNAHHTTVPLIPKSSEPISKLI